MWIDVNKEVPKHSEGNSRMIIATDGERYQAISTSSLYRLVEEEGLFVPSSGGRGLKIKYWFYLPDLPEGEDNGKQD